MHNRVLDFDYCREKGIPVSGTTPRPSPTFELTWALILALAKNVTIDDRAMRGGQWQTVVGTEIRNKTLGVIGLGRIGSEVAKVGNAFGMKVIAWSENMTEERAAESQRGGAHHDRLFRKRDRAIEPPGNEDAVLRIAAEEHFAAKPGLALVLHQECSVL